MLVVPQLPDYYRNDDIESFAFSTCRERWPKILEDAISDITQEATESSGLKSKQAKESIIPGLQLVISDMAQDKPLTKFSKFETDSIPGLKSFNVTFDNLVANKEKLTWLTAPWLFTECYLYRRIDALIKTQSEWQTFDVFNVKKQESFKGTAPAVYELCNRYEALEKELNQKLDESELKTVFKEFIDVCLWGNKVDLSLLATRSDEEVHSGQSNEQRIEAEKNILSNDTEKIWSYLTKDKSLKLKRVDFVLDNSGFETFTDLIFGLFLLDSQISESILVHCKTRPWMVSDTMLKDIDILLNDLLDPEFFPNAPKSLKLIHDKLQNYIKSSKIKFIDSEFWSMDLDYWNISPKGNKFSQEVYHVLSQSDLVFIKGDLNYRKLTGDRKWNKTTSFTTAIGPLAHSGIKLVSLRTCKADVCVGLPQGIHEKLCKEWKEKTGQLGELWSSSGNWAVISYSKGS